MEAANAEGRTSRLLAMLNNAVSDGLVVLCSFFPLFEPDTCEFFIISGDKGHRPPGFSQDKKSAAFTSYRKKAPRKCLNSGPGHEHSLKQRMDGPRLWRKSCQNSGTRRQNCEGINSWRELPENSGTRGDIIQFAALTDSTIGEVFARRVPSASLGLALVQLDVQDGPGRSDTLGRMNLWQIIKADRRQIHMARYPRSTPTI